MNRDDAPSCLLEYSLQICLKIKQIRSLKSVINMEFLQFSDFLHILEVLLA